MNEVLEVETFMDSHKMASKLCSSSNDIEWIPILGKFLDQSRSSGCVESVLEPLDSSAEAFEVGHVGSMPADHLARHSPLKPLENEC